MRQIKKYGWKPDLPDHRDKIFNMSSRIAHQWQLPKQVDLEPRFPPAYDQGQLGSCTGNAWAANMEYMAMQDNLAPDTPSRLFIYYNERVLEGTADQDAGAEIRDGAKVVATQGVPPEADWPYDISQFAVKPSDLAYSAATALEAVEYRRIVPGPGAPMCTALAQGYAIVFGFPVPDYFESGWDPTAAPLEVPGPNDQIIGGHAVVVVGYDFTKTRFSEPVFKIRNSWGTSWGEVGHFFMSNRWFRADERLASDLWVVTKVS